MFKNKNSHDKRKKRTLSLPGFSKKKNNNELSSEPNTPLIHNENERSSFEDDSDLRKELKIFEKEIPVVVKTDLGATPVKNSETPENSGLSKSSVTKIPQDNAISQNQGGTNLSNLGSPQSLIDSFVEETTDRQIENIHEKSKNSSNSTLVSMIPEGNRVNENQETVIIKSTYKEVKTEGDSTREKDQSSKTVEEPRVKTLVNNSPECSTKNNNNNIIINQCKNLIPNQQKNRLIGSVLIAFLLFSVGTGLFFLRKNCRKKKPKGK